MGARFGGWITGSLWVASACGDPQGPPVQPWVIPPPDGDADPGGDDEAEADDGADASSGAMASSDGGAASHTAVTADGGGDDGLEGSSGIAGGSSEAGDGPPASPYMGGWDIGDCQDSIVAGAGVLDDISLSDQFAESVRFYDFCHKAILLTSGSFW